MTITAKFRGVCSVCGGTIHAGDRIEWSKGEPTRHTACPSEGGAQPAASKAQRKPRTQRQAPRRQQPGEITIRRRSSDRGDTYQIGTVIHASKVSGGGGPDEHYFLVVHSWIEHANEDMDAFDEMAGAHVRPATDEECAPVIAAKRTALARQTCEAGLAAALKYDAPGVDMVSDTGSLPPAAEREAEIVLGRKVGDRGAITDGGTTYALTATTVVAHHNGYYDSYRSSTRTVARTEQFAALIRALATNDLDTLSVLADGLAQVAQP